MSIATLKNVAVRLRRDATTVYLVARDPRTGWLVRGLALLVAAYAFSPIDLIPDFIPVIGYLDDLVLVPLGIALVIRLTPDAVIESARREAVEVMDKPVSYIAAIAIVLFWLGIILLLLRWISRAA